MKVRKGNGHYTVRTYCATDGLLTGIATGPTLGSTAIQNLTFDYDGLGNLTGRTVAVPGSSALSESFRYDCLNRLNTGGMRYALNGNIATKDSVDGTNLRYDSYSKTKPHAVTGVTAILGGVEADYTFTYDNNGNLATRERREAGVLKETWSTKWAGFDKPRWLIDFDTTASTAKGDEFTYNANRSRVVHLSIDAVNGTGSSATPKHYSRKKVYGLGPQLEADYASNPSFDPSVPQSSSGWTLQKIRIYVPGPEGIIGTMEFNPRQSFDKAETALVYHYDHLGSIERITPYGSATTAYTLDGQGKPSRYSYDAWGQRRNADTWSGKPATTADGGADDATPRGFTGHEMLDDIGLVHMNGRIYDPLLGRFLSADVMVQFPHDLQSYNRFSYVENRPLTLIDPSGFNSTRGAAQTVEQFEAQMLAAQQALYARRAEQLGEAIVNGDLRGAEVARNQLRRISRRVGADYDNPRPVSRPAVIRAPGSRATPEETFRENFDAASKEAETACQQLARAVRNEAELKRAAPPEGNGNGELKVAEPVSVGFQKPKGSRNPVVNSKRAIGQEAHRQIGRNEFQPKGYKLEVVIDLKSGATVRKDAVKGDEVVIIKPDTPTGRQAAETRSDLMKDNGFRVIIRLYDPNDPAYQPGSPTYIGPARK